MVYVEICVGSLIWKCILYLLIKENIGVIIKLVFLLVVYNVECYIIGEILIYSLYLGVNGWFFIYIGEWILLIIFYILINMDLFVDWIFLLLDFLKLDLVRYMFMYIICLLWYERLV